MFKNADLGRNLDIACILVHADACICLDHMADNAIIHQIADHLEDIGAEMRLECFLRCGWWCPVPYF